MKNLKLPAKSKIKGLSLYCNECRNYYKSDEEISCKCGSLVYRARFYIPKHLLAPGEKTRPLSRSFSDVTFNEAITLTIKFEEELKENDYYVKNGEKDLECRPMLLVDYMDSYMKFLNNDGVDYQDFKQRGEGHIKSFEGIFKNMLLALKRPNRDPKLMAIGDIRGELVGDIVKHFELTLQLADATLWQTFSKIRCFYKFVNEKMGLPIVCPFSAKKYRRNTEREIITFGKREFEAVLSILNRENGWMITNKGLGARMNVYKPWLKDAFQLGLYTGGRREEFMKAKWNNIKIDEEGEMAELTLKDFKVSRSRGIYNDQKAINKPISINPELKELLLSLGFNEKRGKDEYILEPNEINRKRLVTQLSAGFNHFYSSLKTGRPGKCKHLRKTYITSAIKTYGVNGVALSGNTLAIAWDHYNSKIETRNDARTNFRVFN